MSYTCKLYKNTGFNTLNIPGTKAVLELADPHPIVTEALEIVQNRVMGSVRVAVSSFNQVRDVDYIEVGDFFYYAPGGPVMTSDDVATFALVPNFFLSVGGTAALAGQGATLSIADGITSRVHVPKSTDTFGAYTEDDPLMTPAKPLELTTHWFDCQDENGSRTYLETTVELAGTAACEEGETFTGGGYTVTVPKMKSIDSDSKICKYRIYDPVTQTLVKENSSPKTLLYDLDSTANGSTSPSSFNAAVSDQRGITRIRELGVESCIINQVQIPSFFAGASLTNVRSVIKGSGATLLYLTEAQIEQMDGSTGDLLASGYGLNYETGYTIQNNRLNYGSITKYGLMTASGSSAEFNAEDIYESGEPAPHVTYFADPRPTGSPYFRFKNVNNDSEQPMPSFFRNCVQGLPWKQVPLIWTEASGSALNTLKFNNEQKIANARVNTSLIPTLEKVTNAIGAGNIAPDKLDAYDDGGFFTKVGNKITGAISERASDAALNILAPVDNFINETVNAAGNWLGKTKIINRAEREAALSDLGVQNNIVAPTVNFPYNAELIRDFFGNGVLEYRYNYNTADLVRIDKILTMYGYKHTKALEANDFVNRRYFNYVECNNVSLTGDYPKWFLDGIADELKSGVRIWHEPINTAHYLDNPDA